jgi:hypothetical protein
VISFLGREALPKAAMNEGSLGIVITLLGGESIQERKNK